MKDDTILTIGLLALGGYALYRMMKPVEETLSGVGSGITTASQGLGGGISDVATTTADAYDDVTSPLDILGALSKKFSDAIDNYQFPWEKDQKTSQIKQITPAQQMQSQQTFASRYNPFINPTAQSFFTPNTPANSVAPMAIQNTVKLAESDPIVRSAINRKLATPTGKIITTSSTARYTGGIGKSQIKRKVK